MSGRPPRRKAAEPTLAERARDAGLGPAAGAMCVALLGLHSLDTDDLEQPDSDFVGGYGAARQQVGLFEAKVAAFQARVQARVPGAWVGSRPGGVKSLERTMEKYGPTREMPLDLLAGKAVLPSLRSMYEVALLVPDVFKVAAYRDRVLRPQPTGYRDLQFVVDVEGHYAEFKIMHTLIDELDEFEHRIYEIRRSLQAKVRDRLANPGWGEAAWGTHGWGSPRFILSPIEQMVLDTLKATSTQLFESA